MRPRWRVWVIKPGNSETNGKPTAAGAATGS
jgi:hypothetical protein